MMLEGKRPSRPVVAHPACTQWGLNEKIWGLMERCWEADAERRPPAKEIVKMVSGLGPGGTLTDRRPVDNHECLSPSAFRHAVHAKLNPLSEGTIDRVVQWLREEELTGPR